MTIGATIVHVLLFWGVLVVVNIPAAAVGLDFDDGPRAAGEPPGWLVTIAWVVLFTFLGIAHARLDGLDAWGVFALGVLCASYAWYTLGLAEVTGIDARWFGLVGNVVVMIAAASLASWLSDTDGIAAALVATIVPWTGYATLVVIRQLRRRSLG